MKNNILIGILLSLGIACTDSTPNEQPSPINVPPISQDSIIEKYLTNGAHTAPLFSQKWQEWCDKALAVDSTIAYVWQQKAMPLFKQQKHQLAMTYLDKAVQYAPEEHLAYRAFMKCIFVKDYPGAIQDLKHLQTTEEHGYEMDHSYHFYLGLCYLQLNQFDVAKDHLMHSVEFEASMRPTGLPHFLDLFYLGIAYFELEEYELAIEQFDASLAQYSRFAEPSYYKMYCFISLEQRDEAQLAYEAYKLNSDAGYSINEDNAYYELYPYQLREARSF